MGGASPTGKFTSSWKSVTAHNKKNDFAGVVQNNTVIQEIGERGETLLSSCFPLSALAIPS